MPFDLKCLLNVVPLQFYRNGLSLWKSLDENSSWFVSKMLFMKMRNKVLLEKFKRKSKTPPTPKKNNHCSKQETVAFHNIVFLSNTCDKARHSSPKNWGPFWIPASEMCQKEQTRYFHWLFAVTSKICFVNEFNRTIEWMHLRAFHVRNKKSGFMTRVVIFTVEWCDRQIGSLGKTILFSPWQMNAIPVAFEEITMKKSFKTCIPIDYSVAYLWELQHVESV